MAANPYDPVTTTDSTHLADDEWDLPPIRLKGYPRTSCFKSLCDTVRRHPKYVLIGLSAVGIIILVAVIIGVASESDGPSRPCRSEGKWKSAKRGLEFYPKPQDGSVVISFKSKDFLDLKDGPIKRSLDSVMEAYKGINQLNSSVYTDCNSTYAPASKTCRISTQSFGNECGVTMSYGYQSNQPCVLLQLNLLDGESIKPISDKSPLWDAAKSSGMEEHTDPSTVPLRCEGKSETDRAAINSRPGLGRNKQRIDHFPWDGFPSYIYRPRDISLPLIKPAVMVQMTNIPHQHMIHVQCTIWGQLYNEKDEPISHGLLTTEFAVCSDK